jgi:hypothetical protein
MIRALILAAVLGGLSLAITGCHGQAGGSVGGNDTSSMTVPR